MKKILMGTVAALTFATSAMAQDSNVTNGVTEYYSGGVTSSCTVNTTWEQDQYWVNWLDLGTHETLTGALAAAQMNATEPNQSTAAICWIQHVAQVSDADIYQRYQDALGYVPSAAQALSGDALTIYYISTDFTIIVPIPQSFIATMEAHATEAELQEFRNSWVIANNLDGALPHFAGTYTSNQDFLNNWVANWNNLDVFDVDNLQDTLAWPPQVIGSSGVSAALTILNGAFGSGGSFEDHAAPGIHAIEHNGDNHTGTHYYYRDEDAVWTYLGTSAPTYTLAEIQANKWGDFAADITEYFY